MTRTMDQNVLTPLELRITPPDGLPITDWQLNLEVLGKPRDHFKKLIAAEEGGEGTGKALHYHVYLETWRSATWIKKWVYTIAHCHNGEQGNAVFFSRKPHEHTIGYVVKHGNIVVRYGVEETFITEWIAKSEQYKRDKAAESKRKQRVEKSFTQSVRESIATQLESRHELRNTRDVLNMILMEYHGHGKVFPNRSTVENLTATLLYPYQEDLIAAFYLRGFDSLQRT